MNAASRAAAAASVTSLTTVVLRNGFMTFSFRVNGFIAATLSGRGTSVGSGDDRRTVSRPTVDHAGDTNLTNVGGASLAAKYDALAELRPCSATSA
jgi:hypothetical protein